MAVEKLYRYTYLLPPNVEPSYERLDHDMRDCWAGPLPLAEFLALFMAKAPVPTPSHIALPAYSNCEGKGNERLFFKALLEHKLCPHVVFNVPTITEKQKEHTKPGKVVTLTSPEFAEVEEEACDISGEICVPYNWHTLSLLIQFKASLEQDPFGEDRWSELDLKDDDEYCVARGQLARWVADVFDYQHRAHAFQILIFGEHARLVFWDRGGAIVSARFNYVEQPNILAEFLWRYHHMSSDRRGWDPTVSEPSEGEVGVFRRKVTELLAAMNDPESSQRRIHRAEHTLDDDYLPYKITVNAVKTGNTQVLIVQKPLTTSKSPIGRATRAYLAYSITDDRLVFLKDSWRERADDVMDEDSTYFELINSQVPFLPSVLCAGDVIAGQSKQHTILYGTLGEDGGHKVKRTQCQKRAHHRVVQELAYAVSTAVNSREYTQAFRNAIQAIGLASEAGIVHCDISINNIMLNEKGLGILNDWDLAYRINPGDSTTGPRRRGTWAFMSLNMVRDPSVRHTILDDFEAAFWGKLYGAIKHLKGQVEVGVEGFYEKSIEIIGGRDYTVGGLKKFSVLEGGCLGKMEFGCIPFMNLIHKLRYTWALYYRARSDDKFCNTPEARENLEKKQQQLSSWVFWVEIFENALNETGWENADMTEDRCPDKQVWPATFKVPDMLLSTIFPDDSSRQVSDPTRRQDSGIQISGPETHESSEVVSNQIDVKSATPPQQDLSNNPVELSSATEAALSQPTAGRKRTVEDMEDSLGTDETPVKKARAFTADDGEIMNQSEGETRACSPPVAGGVPADSGYCANSPAPTNDDAKGDNREAIGIGEVLGV